MTTATLQKLDERVNAMIGKTYLYKTLPYKVLSQQLADNKLTLVTDRRWFVVDVQHCTALLNEFLETDDTLLPDSRPPALPKPALFESTSSLHQILMDNIKNLQTNKEYIPQAVEIANQVDTMINLARTELRYYEILNIHK